MDILASSCSIVAAHLYTVCEECVAMSKRMNRFIFCILHTHYGSMVLKSPCVAAH